MGPRRVSRICILGIDHAAIKTARLEETQIFSVQVLGLRVGPRPSFGFNGAWLYADDKSGHQPKRPACRKPSKMNCTARAASNTPDTRPITSVPVSPRRCNRTSEARIAP